ncbi:prephenate dehydratase [Sesbania bispinosa]|nr:prephenate dehydratase [Sesbania bispinosa]
MSDYQGTESDYKRTIFDCQGTMSDYDSTHDDFIISIDLGMVSEWLNPQLQREYQHHGKSRNTP